MGEFDHAGAHGDDARVGVHAVAGKRGEFAPAWSSSTVS
jgi:hypothetical protein